jgi:serine/threonine protein kinase
LYSLKPKYNFAKLGDFGLSTRLGAKKKMNLGSFQWLPPEVFEGRNFDTPADIYG